MIPRKKEGKKKERKEFWQRFILSFFCFRILPREGALNEFLKLQLIN